MSEHAAASEESEPEVDDVSSESSQEPTIDFEAELILKQRRIQELEAKLAAYETKTIEIREYVKKMEGEIEQIRIRASRDLQKSIDAQLGSFLKELLQIADNIDRSVAAIHEDSPLATGVKLIQQQAHEFLAKAGLVRMQTKGEVFDPHLHEALTMMLVESEESDGRIVEEVKPGYRFKETVLRPAQVVVGKKSDA